MAISRGQLVKELEPGLNALFGLEYNNYANEHAEIFDTENSDRAFEEEVMYLVSQMHRSRLKELQFLLTVHKKLSQLVTHMKHLH